MGLLQAGWKGLFAVEQDKNAFATLKANLMSPESRFKFAWPTWLPQSPIGVADALIQYCDAFAKMAGTVDLLVGGPPCQGFSAAGRRDPSDPRNSLFKSYLKFVELLRPRIVLVENVRGFTIDFHDANSTGGKVNYAAWLTNALQKDYEVFTKVLDLSDFGVPQKRHRVFIIAVRRDCKSKFVQCPFEAIETGRMAFLRSKRIPSIPVGSKSAISDLEISRNGTRPSADTIGFEEISYRRPITTYQRLMNAGAGTRMSDTRLARHSPPIAARFKKIIDLCHSNGRLNISLSTETRSSLGLRKAAIRVLDPDKPAPTITSMPDDLLHYSEPRALTVRENARLQGFPDWFRFMGKYTSGGERRRSEIPRFTQVANAVPPLVAEAIGAALLRMIDASMTTALI